MSMDVISSSSNSQIKNIVQLQKKAKIRNDQDVFVVEGIKMYEETPPEQLQKAYFSESYFEELKNSGRDMNVYMKGKPYEVVKDSVFKEASDTMAPQGVLAVVKQTKYSLEAILSQKDANLVILEDLRDPGNLGTIVRTAEGAGVTGIVLSRNCVDIYNPKVIRSTMGSIFRMPHIYVEDLGEALEAAKKQGISLYAAHLAGERTYDLEDYVKKTGILIGNEANGLSDEIASMADHYIRIPMEGKVESLNAAIAACVLMYEIYRQRRSK